MIKYHTSKVLGISYSTKCFFSNIAIDFITRGSVNAPGSLGDLYGDFVSDPETETNAENKRIELYNAAYFQCAYKQK